MSNRKTTKNISLFFLKEVVIRKTREQAQTVQAVIRKTREQAQAASFEGLFE